MARTPVTSWVGRFLFWVSELSSLRPPLRQRENFEFISADLLQCRGADR